MFSVYSHLEASAECPPFSSPLQSATDTVDAKKQHVAAQRISAHLGARLCLEVRTRPQERRAYRRLPHPIPALYAPPPPSAKPPHGPLNREVCLWRAADGTKDYVDMMAYDLSRLAVTGLMNKTAVSPSDIDYVLWGTVSQEIRTSNIARDVALGSGLPKSVTGHTVTQACISANQAICNGVQQIQTGRADVVIAGGVETFSDAAIRFSRAGMPRVPPSWLARWGAPAL